MCIWYVSSLNFMLMFIIPNIAIGRLINIRYRMEFHIRLSRITWNVNSTPLFLDYTNVRPTCEEDSDLPRPPFQADHEQCWNGQGHELVPFSQAIPCPPCNVYIIDFVSF